MTDNNGDDNYEWGGHNYIKYTRNSGRNKCNIVEDLEKCDEEKEKLDKSKADLDKDEIELTGRKAELEKLINDSRKELATANRKLKTIKDHSRPAIEAGESVWKIKKQKFDLQLIGNREANNFRKSKQKLDRHMKTAGMDPDSICKACHSFFFNIYKEKKVNISDENVGTKSCKFLADNIIKPLDRFLEDEGLTLKWYYEAYQTSNLHVLKELGYIIPGLKKNGVGKRQKLLPPEASSSSSSPSAGSSG